MSGLENIRVKVGEEAELTCTADSQIAFCIFTSPSGNQYTFSGVGQEISYDDGRIVYFGSNPERECGIKITSVTDSDNGKWKCSITSNVGGSGKTGSGSANVTVVKAPSSVHLEPTFPEDSLLLNYPKDSQTKISCVADGGRPEPTFSWKIGDQKIAPHIVSTDANRRPDGSTVVNQTIHYESRPEHNGKSLACVVHSEGYNQTQLEKEDNVESIQLNIQYQPTASKKEELVFYGLKVGQLFEVQITFESNPAPDQILWKMYDNEEVAMGSESPTGRYVSSLVNPGPLGAEGTYTAVLKIKAVQPEDAETVNILVVKNKLGETEIRFRLGMGEQPPADSEGFEVESLNESEAAAGPIIAIVVIILVVIAVIAVAVIARSQGLLCFAAKDGSDDSEKAQFEPLEKGEQSPEKEPVKEVKSAPIAVPEVKIPVPEVKISVGSTGDDQPTMGHPDKNENEKLIASGADSDSGAVPPVAVPEQQDNPTA